jgi:hypothetical protein
VTELEAIGVAVGTQGNTESFVSRCASAVFATELAIEGLLA